MNSNNEWNNHYEKATEEISDCNFATAEEHLKTAFNAVQAGSASPEEIECTLAVLAQVQRFQGDYDASAKTFKQLVELQKEIRGTNNVEVGLSLKDWGDMCFESGKFASAEMFLKQSLGILEKRLTPLMRDFAATIDAISVCYRMLSRYEEALDHAERAIALLELISGPDGSGLIQPLDNYALTLGAVGQHSKAAEVQARADSLRRQFDKQREKS